MHTEEFKDKEKFLEKFGTISTDEQVKELQEILRECYALLLCDVLYCTVLYCTVLYCTVLCCGLYCSTTVIVYDIFSNLNIAFPHHLITREIHASKREERC